MLSKCVADYSSRNRVRVRVSFIKFVLFVLQLPLTHELQKCVLGHLHYRNMAIVESPSLLFNVKLRLQPSSMVFDTLIIQYATPELLR